MDDSGASGVERVGAQWGLVSRICAAQLVSVLGENILLATAIPLWAWDATSSAEGVGIALGAVTAAALFSLPAGAWASRHSTRTVLIGCGLLRLLASLALSVFRRPPFDVVIIIIFSISLVDSFFMPCLKAALPDLAPAADLLRANSFLEATDIPAQFLGPPIAVLIYERSGLAGAAAAQAAAYAVSLTILARASFPAHQQSNGGVPTLWVRLRATLRATWDSPPIRATLIGWSSGTIAVGIAEALILPFIEHILVQPETVFGLFGAMLGVGMAIGAGLSAWLVPESPSIRLLAGSAIWVTVSFAAFAHGRSVSWCGAALLLAGAGMVWVHISADTLLQTKLHEDARGGALGLTHTIEAAGLLVGLAVGAYGAPHLGVRHSLDVAVILLLFTSIVAAMAAHGPSTGATLVEKG